jgi:hypothetical protein
VSYPLAAEDPGGADEREVGERLRELADLPAADDIVLLGVQAEVIAQGEPPLKQLPRLGVAAVDRERPDQPERAGQELALGARQAVIGDVGRVAGDKSLVAQPASSGMTAGTGSTAAATARPPRHPRRPVDSCRSIIAAGPVTVE